MSTPKMRTQATLTPEQIRTIVSDHRRRIARAQRRRDRVRTLVRIVFWLAVGFIGYKCLTMIDDYHSTCEALGKVCIP